MHFDQARVYTRDLPIYKEDKEKNNSLKIGEDPSDSEIDTVLECFNNQIYEQTEVTAAINVKIVEIKKRI